jgi:hypothetical protein
MSASVWSFADASGALTVTTLSGPEAAAQAHAQALGLVAIEGQYDHLSQRVDLATGQVIDYQPPAPADTALATHRWDADTRRWVAEPTLEAHRQQQWERIKSERNRAERQGTFEALGSTFDSDPTRIGGAVTAATVALSAQQPFSVTWTLADNTARTLDALQMVAVGLAQMAHIDGLHARARQLRAALADATTPEEVAAITWTQEPAP